MSKAPGKRLVGRHRDLPMRDDREMTMATVGGDNDGDGRGHLCENDPHDGGGDDSRACLCRDNGAPREPRPGRRSGHRRLLPPGIKPLRRDVL